MITNGWLEAFQGVEKGLFSMEPLSMTWHLDAQIIGSLT